MKRIVQFCLLCAGCGAGGSGDLDIRLAAEASITDGLSAGASPDDVVDGWSVDFDLFAIAIGRVHVGRAGDARAFDRPETLAVDLAQAPAAGFPFASFEALPVGAWDDVRFETANAAGATRDASLAQADFDEMVAGGCTFLVSGSLRPGAGAMSCPPGGACRVVSSPISFRLCIPAATAFGPCQDDTGISGVVVAAATTTTANVTIHGDHLFFNGFPEGAEGTVARRAQWLANADTDADDRVTEAELRAIGPTQLGVLFPSTFSDGFPGYSLGGAPRVDGHGLETAWDYVRAQMRTVGHFQGEGECPWDDSR
jgi:hypothetical protein